MNGWRSALNRRRYERLQAVLARRQPDLTVLMEQVNKPHNFSAILRNGDAVGILDAHVVLPEKGINLSNHTSAGTSKWVRVHTHPSVRDAIEHLHGNGLRVLAAHPSPNAVDYREVDFTKPVAVMVGAELDGMSEEGLSLADEKLVIPMVGMARSLNVSVAMALILFEAFRQRTEAGMYESSRLDQDTFRTLLFEWTHPILAQLCRKKGMAYPPLTEEGEPVLEPGATQG
jgi:tRNA (guanosine-2'-O-)-methyltransferase